MTQMMFMGLRLTSVEVLFHSKLEQCFHQYFE